MRNVEKRVLEIVESAFEESKLNVHLKNVDEDIVQMGIDSLMLMSIIVALEEEFNVEIPDEKLILTEMNSVRKITKILLDIL